MIVRYFPTGNGCGKAPVNYLLGVDRDREEAELLRGDPDNTIDIIDSSNYAKTYTSGVLAFTETEKITKDIQNKIMDEFERATFPGMSKDQYDVLWIKHTEKANTELHFVIPNVELSTGKRLQPYFDKADRPRITEFQNIQNIKYDLADPFDPKRKADIELLKTDYKMKVDNMTLAEYKDTITTSLWASIDDGAIENREGLIDKLNSAGITVTGEKENYIQIENPKNPDKNIRLKGPIYAKSFRSVEELRTDQRERENNYRKEQKRTLESRIERYEGMLKYKEKSLQKSYGRGNELSKENLSKEKKSIENSIQQQSREYSNSSVSRGDNSDRNNPNSRQIPLSEDKTKTRKDRSNRDRDRSNGTMGSERNNLGRTPIHSSTQEHDNSRRRIQSGREKGSQTNKGLDNDRNRKTITGYIGKLRERARDSAKGIKEFINDFASRIRGGRGGLQNTRKGVKETIQGEQSYSRIPENFRQQTNNLDRIIKQEKEINRSRSVSYGHGMGY